MGDRPQQIINKQLLKNCDLLVAVFWTRLGSPTGEAVSGAVEEFNEHVAAGKPAMMVALTADDIDCIVAYIVPLDLWYVLPVEEFSPCKNLWFYPHGSKKASRFESFREAWWPLDPSQKPATDHVETGRSLP